MPCLEPYLEVAKGQLLVSQCEAQQAVQEARHTLLHLQGVQAHMHWSADATHEQHS
jgi:hypothetical protein